MAKNLIPEIAKMLGVELGEEFKIKGYDDSNTRTYKFTAQGLRVKLVEYKHLKPPGSEFLPRLVMIRRTANVVFRRDRYAWLSLKKLFVQRMKAKHPEAVKKWPKNRRQ